MPSGYPLALTREEAWELYRRHGSAKAAAAAVPCGVSVLYERMGRVRPLANLNERYEAYKFYGTCQAAGDALGVSRSCIQQAVALFEDRPAARKLDEPTVAARVAAWREHGSYRKAARALGVGSSSIHRAVVKARETEGDRHEH